MAAWIEHTRRRAGAHYVSGPELLAGSEFQAAAAAGRDGGVLTLWGQGAYGRFDGQVGDLAVDGDVATGRWAWTGRPVPGWPEWRCRTVPAGAATGGRRRAAARWPAR